MVFRVMKDLVDEYRDARYREEREARKKELSEYKANNFISKSGRRYLTFISGAFLFYGIFMLLGEIKNGMAGKAALTVAELLMCLASVILLRIKNKGVQKVGCIMFWAFVAVQLLRSLMLI